MGVEDCLIFLLLCPSFFPVTCSFEVGGLLVGRSCSRTFKRMILRWISCRIAWQSTLPFKVSRTHHLLLGSLRTSLYQWKILVNLFLTDTWVILYLWITCAVLEYSPYTCSAIHEYDTVISLIRKISKCLVPGWGRWDPFLFWSFSPFLCKESHFYLWKKINKKKIIDNRTLLWENDNNK